MDPEKAKNVTTVPVARTGARPSTDIPSEDLHVPIQLLQATGNIGSTRDQRSSLSWEPQSAVPTTLDRTIGSISRHGEQPVRGPSQRRQEQPVRGPSQRRHEQPVRGPSQRRHEQPVRGSSQRHHSHISEAPSWNEAADEGHNLGRITKSTTNQTHKRSLSLDRRLSYTPGSEDVLASDSGRNPFASPQDSSSSSFSDSSSTRRNSVTSEHAYGPPKTSDQEHQNTERGGLHGIQRRITNASYAQRSGMWQTYQKAKLRSKELQRNKYSQFSFQYSIYAFLILFIYFVLIGMPLWNGAVWWMWWVVSTKFVIAGGFGIVLGIALFYAFVPLICVFEDDPPPAAESDADTKLSQSVQETALLIPCYKSASLIAATLEAALKIFPPSHIFVIANGNSETPLDNTEEVCRPYAVNHIWSPIGSKIVAQFVGCHAAKTFKNVLLIDDDCALPDNFPVVTERLVGRTQCIGYTIKSVGPNSSKGNLCQQAQDLEYKLSGIQREFAGRIGSATFPHGAISLWDRELLINTFNEHPGFSVSEDWFFGHVARKLGSRIKMCSQVFVETETPTAVFFSSGGSRGGFGEMTIFSQRFKRWNFFFVNGMWYNMAYIFGSWKLGWWEIGAKIFVFQEVYETLLYLLTPFVLPISFYVRPSFCGILLGATVGMYLLNVILFNEVHLRRKNERLGWVLLYVYYLPYKIVLTFINVASCYWSLWKYAQYFAKRHPKVTEDEKAIEVVIRLEEDAAPAAGGIGRRLTVRAVGGRPSTDSDDDEPESTLHGTSTHPIDTRNIQIVTAPELVHMNAPAMEAEGISSRDFNHHRQNSWDHDR